MTVHNWQTPYGVFRLQRYPSRKRDPLLPWCSADQLLLEAAHAHGIAVSASVLVVNDTHGALCLALQPTALWTDSALSAQALQNNAALNQAPATPVVWSTDTPPAVQWALLRIPKQLRYLEYQLAHLAAVLPSGASLLAAGMDKHLTPRTAELLEQYIGPTQRFPGQKKARVFAAIRDRRVAELPAMREPSYYCDEVAGELNARPNVFSAERLDQGSRLLLSQLTELQPVGQLADLACGNGVLGLAALRCRLARSIVFADESAQAIAAATDNALRLFPGERNNLSFVHGDGFEPIPDRQFDLVLCNPPFHQEHTVDSFVGARLIRQSARALAAGGKLLLVANRHLKYTSELRRGFKRVDQIAQTRKFRLFLAQK